MTSEFFDCEIYRDGFAFCDCKKCGDRFLCWIDHDLERADDFVCLPLRCAAGHAAELTFFLDSLELAWEAEGGSNFLERCEA